ncbi:MAG: peptide chain release factor N(5)-glutamine methyltransferase [Synergistaceae bacterium]|nr:peptide chain release factor N(5)-glutamine methyltransferase [Synergistota bacterium]NLM72063.1 peptide chain release factor N(5)-glutamine methyltransferase [Synergistaceae bacterium]
MTVFEARRRILRALSEAGVPSPGFEADMILRHVLNSTGGHLLAHPEEKTDDNEINEIQRIVARRVSREPLQHIIGSWDFFGRTLETPPGVLIPRPETELLVEIALDLTPPQGGLFLDWGTGTGCIALSLLCESRALEGLAADCNPLAISACWRNLRRHGVLDRCLVLHSRTPEDLPLHAGSLDMLVSNPPYIKTDQLPHLVEEVRYEPVSALDGGVDGMRWYRRLSAAAEVLLKPGGWLLFEVGDEYQAEAILQSASPSFLPGGTHRDYSGISRVLVMRRV